MKSMASANINRTSPLVSLLLHSPILICLIETIQFVTRIIAFHLLNQCPIANAKDVFGNDLPLKGIV